MYICLQPTDIQLFSTIDLCYMHVYIYHWYFRYFKREPNEFGGYNYDSRFDDTVSTSTCSDNAEQRRIDVEINRNVSLMKARYNYYDLITAEDELHIILNDVYNFYCDRVQHIDYIKKILSEEARCATYEMWYVRVFISSPSYTVHVDSCS